MTFRPSVKVSGMDFYCEFYDRRHCLDTCELHVVVVLTYGWLRTASNWGLTISCLINNCTKQCCATNCVGTLPSLRLSITNYLNVCKFLYCDNGEEDCHIQGEVRLLRLVLLESSRKPYETVVFLWHNDSEMKTYWMLRGSFRTTYKHSSPSLRISVECRTNLLF